MKIIGAGWGRTGTTSATAALERLGAGPCLHMTRMRPNPMIAAAFVRHTRGEPVDWRTELAGWQSGTDWPVCWAWRELADLYPDAPVLLTVRDPDAWYESVRATIHLTTGPDAEIRPPVMHDLLRALWDVEFGSWEAVLDRDHAIARFEAHNASVRAECPPERLIEWSVADGWDPLCAALGVDVPDEPFPQLNDRVAFHDRKAR